MAHSPTQKQWNNVGILSKWKAYNAEGEFVDVVKLTPEKKAWYEKRGWTFERTTLPYVTRRAK